MYADRPQSERHALQSETARGDSLEGSDQVALIQGAGGLGLAELRTVP